MKRRILKQKYQAKQVTNHRIQLGNFDERCLTYLKSYCWPNWEIGKLHSKEIEQLNLKHSISQFPNFP